MMIWRTLPSPWIAGGSVLSRSLNLPNCFVRSRSILSSCRVRPLHNNPSSTTATSPAVAPVRYARLQDDPGQYEGHQIKITGLIRSVRKQKKVAFARVADGSTLAGVQAVFPNPALAKEYVYMDSVKTGGL